MKKCKMSSLFHHSFWSNYVFYDFFFLFLSSLKIFYKKRPVCRVRLLKCTIKTSLYYFTVC